MSRSKLTAPVHLEEDFPSKDLSVEKIEAPRRSMMNSRQSQRLSRARSKQKQKKIQQSHQHIASQQLELNNIEINVSEPLLDIAILNDKNAFGSGEFGLKEYILDGKGSVEEEYYLIENQVILDVHQDFNGRLIFTNPEESSIYMVRGEDIVFVSQFNILMAGLNIRLSKNGECLYFQNKPKFLAQINLANEPFNIDRVYNIKELPELVKFEADILGSEVVAMSSSGIIKVSEKNMTYHVSTEKNQKFSTFIASPDDKYLVVSGTTKESSGKNETTLYSYKSAKGGVLKKVEEFKIKTHWTDEGYDVMIDISISEKRGSNYYIGTASLYTGEFFCLTMESGVMHLVSKINIRSPGIQTCLVKYKEGKFWATGDDGNLNMIDF